MRVPVAIGEKLAGLKREGDDGLVKRAGGDPGHSLVAVAHLGASTRLLDHLSADFCLKPALLKL